jgi:hypothetical protein
MIVFLENFEALRDASLQKVKPLEIKSDTAKNAQEE